MSRKCNDNNLITGRLQVTSKGFGFVIPEGQDKTDDIFIPRRDLKDAMNGDTVQVRLADFSGGRRPEGRVVAVLNRKFTKVVGTFVQAGDFAFVEPDDKHLEDVFIPKREFHGAKHLDKVYVEITVYPDALEHRKAEGRVLEVLGKLGDVGLEILSIIKQKDLPLEFPKEVLAAAAKIPEAVKKTELRGRLDRRDRMIVTIDGEDAKDFDDAIYVAKVPGKQQWDLGVYIADVSYYVDEGGLIDVEAQARGTSVYLVDRVLPMLPERLCNGICSLNEDVDRLVMACEMRINAKGAVLDYTLAPAVIHSRHRLTYNIVREILKGDKKLQKKYEDCVPMLMAANELRQVLGRMRHDRGAINFELPEVRVELDENLHPIDIKQRIQGDAENLIEEFMLAANECVARHLTKAHYPAVYRVHDVPKQEKMEELSRLLAMFGVVFKVGEDEDVRPIDVQRVLEKMEGRPEERMVSNVALRCMRQAVYQTENIGHFGLAAQDYVHFTSPIRRYPDLLIHRLLRKQWAQNKLKAAEFEALQENLEVLARHASERERLAADGERATQELKMCEYMAERIGEEYDGYISGVTNFGIFVELPNGVEGMVRIENLKDDYYDFVEDRYAVVGVRTHKQYRLGDKVRIVVTAVSIEDITIDFELVAGAPVQHLSAAKGKKQNGKATAKDHSRKQKSASRLQSGGKMGVRHRTDGHRSEGPKAGKGKSKGRLRSGDKKRRRGGVSAAHK